MMNEHTSLEKYTSHTLFSKGLQKACERVDVGYHIYQPLRSGRIWHKVNF